jgi:mxaD protein
MAQDPFKQGVLTDSLVFVSIRSIPMKNPIRQLTVATGLLLAAACVLAAPVAFEREATIDSNPDTVWKFVGDFNSVDIWHPSVLTSKLQGNTKPTRPGAIRVLKLIGGAELVEKLVKYSATEKSYTFTGVKSPLPVKSYFMTISLTPTADGKTVMKWSSLFEPNPGVDEDIATEVVAIALDGGLAKVVANFQR